MPIDFQAGLMRLNPLTPLTGLGGSDQLDMERQRLELLRQEFEETKRKNLQDEEYKRLAEQAAVRREQIALQKQQEQERAAAAAENLKQRQLALGEFNKQYGEGNLEAMALAANQLNQLGGYAKRLDTGGPFPAYQVDLEPPKVPAGLNPMDSLGYGTLGTPDALPETEKGAAPSLSTEEAFRQAGSVPADVPAVPMGGDPTTDTPDALSTENPAPGEYGPPTAGQAQAPAAAPSAAIQGLTPGMTSFVPRRAAEAPDMTGGVSSDVPSDVINTAALQYQRQQRLGPVMAQMAGAMPESLRGPTEQAGNAMLAAGLSPEKTMQNAQAARQEVAGAYEKEQAHEFKMQEDAAKAAAEEKDPIKRQKRIQYGRSAAKEAYKEAGVHQRVGVLEAADDVQRMLTDDIPENDEYVVNLLMKLDAQVGAQSDKDATRVTGENKASFVTRLEGMIHTLAAGGYSDEFKNSMIDFANNLKERNRQDVHDYIEEMQKRADTEEDPLAGEGYRRFVNGVIPKSILADYDKEAGQEPGGATLTKTSYEHGAGDALENAADANGFDAGAIRRVIGGESGGDPRAASKNSSAKGLWQALDTTAQRYVNPETGQKFKDSAELAKLPPAQQYAVLMQYLSDSGVTENSPPEDYALAIAAPAFVGKGAHEDMVVYKKGTDDWAKNKPWQPADGGDITVGSIIDYYFGNKKKGAPAATSAKPGKGADDAEALEGL